MNLVPFMHMGHLLYETDAQIRLHAQRVRE
jgi:hypothetical protein